MPKLSLYARIKSGEIRVTLLSSPEHRFWKNLTKSGAVHPVHGRCWEWLRSLNHNGYGQFVAHGQAIGAHRFAYSYFISDIPDGLFVLHKCDNRKCVNPSHLFVGTTLDNQRDKVAKDRQAKGVQNYKAKLTDDQIREIRRRYVRKSHSVSNTVKLAEEFGVTPTNIIYIVRRLTWKHVN